MNDLFVDRWQDKEAEIQKAVEEAQQEIHKYAEMLEAKDKTSRSVMGAKNQVVSAALWQETAAHTQDRLVMLLE
jgi:hypothetical protein